MVLSDKPGNDQSSLSFPTNAEVDTALPWHIPTRYVQTNLHEVLAFSSAFFSAPSASDFVVDCEEDFEGLGGGGGIGSFGTVGFPLSGLRGLIDLWLRLHD